MQSDDGWCGALSGGGVAPEGHSTALSRAMTELSTNALFAAAQILLGDQERAFIASCDSICFVADAADGWPNIRVVDPRAAALEVVNSQALRLRFDRPLPSIDTNGSKRIALLLMRRIDGQHLIIHGHVATETGSTDDWHRMRISVASRSWSPDLAGGTDPVIARALYWA
jgi:hypothetical protein